ncbi:MAG TPA: DNA repair protein RecO [Flavobacteriia bacterium]|nr:DNA repair protein RecO [Flavobacteriia bacterium]
MLVKTQAIVIQTTKFQESSLIVKCYTEIGIKSYFLKGILKSKSKQNKAKIAYFQKFTLLDILAKHNNKGNLNYIKEISVNQPLHSIHTNIYKSTIVLFLSEILNSVLVEEEENTMLFSYLSNALIWLDTHDKTANFHLLFLLNLTKYLGFYPKTQNYPNAFFFHLTEGVFTTTKPHKNYLSDKKLNLFKSLIGINFDALTRLEFNAKERNEMIQFLLTYFSLHLPEFKKPKSLPILQRVFS